ncbi:hypothetical protein JQ607_11830 [Bradyrhizobium liaoningense]|uniref:hypothetical protein n=1 Tax=Bradyrhizobium liaoningense TaxID=43992 RepID=UPI001BACEBB3|nr:hypothetical protein [Bradyrhizobium liaoningense]MBR0840879.1 hypothetical protein [Bradyrhizobium liaoningense]
MTKSSFHAAHIRAALFVVASGLGAAALWPAATEAANDKHYGVVCVRNNTRANITYMRKVGEGGWETRFIEPGGEWRMAHRYDRANENSSPKVHVKYDADATGRNFTQFKDLERRAAVGDTCQEGYVYAFQYEARNRSFISLERVQ